MSIVVGQRYLHKRRGAWYEVLGLAKMQIGASTFAHKLDGHEDVACSVLEKKSLVVYRSLDDDDTLWVRPESEFLDGRFERHPNQLRADLRIELEPVLTQNMEGGE